jgi:integrase
MEHSQIGSSMEDQIKVSVVDFGNDRGRNLMLRYRDPITKKLVTKSSGTRDWKEALKAAGKWQDELRSGRYKPTINVAWEDFRNKYEGEVATGLAENTQIRISGIFDSVENHLNPVRVRDITSAQLSSYVKKLREAEYEETTIATHLAHLRAALRYAVEWGYISELPTLPRQHRVKRTKTMKGRPITGEEYERMLTSTASVVGLEVAPSWKRLLEGLWLSGLRISEALSLYWSDAPNTECLELDYSHKRPMFRIPADAEKGNQDRLLPMAPEFAEFLEKTPQEARTGLVFPVSRQRKRYPGQIKLEHASSTISAIGKKAGVKVNAETGKCASAHDLRRAFGQRWAARVMPQILMQLMRHEDISTTMKFYVGREAEATADVLWEAVGKGEKPGKSKKCQPRCQPQRKSPTQKPENFKNSRGKEAGELGFEPRLKESESFVLPLHHSPVIVFGRGLECAAHP